MTSSRPPCIAAAQTKFNRTLDMHICNLRRKLGRHGDLIRTVRGVGYLCASSPTPREPRNMRSIFSKVMFWCVGTFALSLVAFWAISQTLDRRGPPKGDPFPHFLKMVEDDLCHAYEKGGPSELAAGLHRLDGYLPGEHLLTDECGRNLGDGADRSEL